MLVATSGYSLWCLAPVDFSFEGRLRGRPVSFPEYEMLCCCFLIAFAVCCLLFAVLLVLMCFAELCWGYVLMFCCAEMFCVFAVCCVFQ